MYCYRYCYSCGLSSFRGQETKLAKLYILNEKNKEKVVFFVEISTCILFHSPSGQNGVITALKCILWGLKGE